MIFYLNDIVEVIKSADDKFGYSNQYRGCVGKIIHFSTGTVGGTSNDPEIIVLFDDGSKDLFWTEELELFCGKDLVA